MSKAKTAANVRIAMFADRGAVMGDASVFTTHELEEAHRALLSTLSKCEKIDVAKLPASQRALLERRIAALKVALALIERETAEEKPSRFAAFEAVYKEVSDSINSIPAELEKLKAAGKEKTVRYKELLGQKLMNNYIATLFERHGISFEKEKM